MRSLIQPAKSKWVKRTAGYSDEEDTDGAEDLLSRQTVMNMRMNGDDHMMT